MHVQTAGNDICDRMFPSISELLVEHIRNSLHWWMLKCLQCLSEKSYALYPVSSKVIWQSLSTWTVKRILIWDCTRHPMLRWLNSCSHSWTWAGTNTASINPHLDRYVIEYIQLDHSYGMIIFDHELVRLSVGLNSLHTVSISLIQTVWHVRRARREQTRPYFEGETGTFQEFSVCPKQIAPSAQNLFFNSDFVYV